MVNDILTPMNHREIEYNAKKLSGCNIPGSFEYDDSENKGREEILKWLDDTGKRVFDDDLVMDYGTDCLRLYLMFENTPKENDAPYYDSWNEGALEGMYKFLGRYRTMILAADEWNKRGNYNPEIFTSESSDIINKALDETKEKIDKYIKRGNEMPNRHNIVSALMELLNVYRKELKTGEIITSLHKHAIDMAVPHTDDSSLEKMIGAEVEINTQVTELYCKFIVLMSPYVPDMSKILWNYVK